MCVILYLWWNDCVCMPVSSSSSSSQIWYGYTEPSQSIDRLCFNLVRKGCTVVQFSCRVRKSKSIQLLLMSDEIITNTHQNIRHKLCAITSKYLVDVLHNRTRAIYSSQNEQANEINDDQSQPSSDTTLQYIISTYKGSNLHVFIILDISSI